jgi:hypothetical protein
LGDSLEDPTLVDVTAIEGMPDRPDKCVETANAQHEKIGVKMMHGPWRFESDTPIRQLGYLQQPGPPLECV